MLPDGREMAGGNNGTDDSLQFVRSRIHLEDKQAHKCTPVGSAGSEVELKVLVERNAVIARHFLMADASLKIGTEDACGRREESPTIFD